MGYIKKKIEYILKHNLLIQKIYILTFSSFFKLVGFFVKTNPNLVLINSFGGRRYNDSSRAVFEKILADNSLNHLNIVWAFETPEKIDVPAEKVKIDTLKYFITALKAKYWISNVNIERGLHFKKKQTRYLNTWHGTPLKLVGNAVSGRKDFKFSNIDVFCYAGSYEKDIYIRDFGICEKNMVMCGLPRNDELYHVKKKHVDFLREKYDIPSGKKVLLYAPTWRDSNDSGKTYSLKPPINVGLWENKLKDEYVVFFRMHYFTTKVLGLEFNDFIRDGSRIQDINDLLIISDILISDYSATIFDYSILERPIISFAYDYNDYMNDRGFYLDLKKKLPSGILETEEQVLHKIKNMNYEVECQKTKLFKIKYLEVGGFASDICVDLLFNKRS